MPFFFFCSQFLHITYEEYFEEGRKNMVENRHDQIQEMKSQIGESEFMQTLSYYNIGIVKDSILCPLHHDRHYDSCRIHKDHKSAYCFVCQKNIDSITLVSHFEGSNFLDSIQFLWADILGREIPKIEKEGTRKKKILSYAELQYIGLSPKPNKQAMYAVNEIFRMDTPPEGYIVNWKQQDEDGYYAIGKSIPRYTIYDLYEDNKEAALSILRGKVRESREWCYNQLEDIRNPKTELGTICRSDLTFKMEMHNEIRMKLKYLKEISTKLEKAVY